MTKENQELDPQYVAGFRDGYNQSSKLFRNVLKAMKKREQRLIERLQAFATDVHNPTDDMISMGSVLAMEQAMFALDAVKGTAETPPPAIGDYTAGHVVYSSTYLSFMLALAIDEITYDREQAISLLEKVVDKATKFLVRYEDLDIEWDVEKI